MTDDVERILHPDSVAIVGASRDETKRGYQTIKRLQEWGYEGDVYPINPKYAGDEILGFDTYGSVSDVPGPVDVALVVTPAHTVTSILADCGAADVAGAMVVAAGFGEIGNHDLEQEVLEAAREHGVRMIGPNINGLINVHERLDLLGKEIDEGELALLSQSGNIASQLVAEADHQSDVGFSFYISVGNETDVKFHEYLPVLADHEETGAVVVYAEGMSDGRSFVREAREFVREKPIVALKGGISDVGKQSAKSHTASIAGNGAVIDAVYDQAGVVRVERMDDLLAVSDALASQPPADGPNVAILSDGGGHATHAADCLAEEGIAVPALEPETQARIRDLVPEQAPNVVNPVDVLTLEYDVDIFYECADAMLGDPNIDVLLLCGYFGGYDRYADELAKNEVDVAERIVDLPEKYGKPIVAQSMFAKSDSPGVAALDRGGIPTFESLNRATRTVSALIDYGTHLAVADEKGDFEFEARGESSPLVREAIEDGRTQLSEYESKHLLVEAGAPVTPFALAETSEEAVVAANAYDGPVAMKVASPDIVHKTEAGGVALDVAGEDSVEATFEDLVANAREHDPDAEVRGVLVSPMAEGDVETIVGVTRDEEVGPVAMFGLGGIFVEVLEDVSFRGLPLTEYDAREMIDEIDAAEILDGARGNPPVDRDALVDLLLDVSAVVADNPAIAELDLNPVFASEDGVEIVDAAIVLDPDRASEPRAPEAAGQTD